jgi:hypothetical protein
MERVTLGVVMQTPQRLPGKMIDADLGGKCSQF